MTIKHLREASGMTQKAFSEYFGISKRSIENWEGGKRECPAYLSELIEYKLVHEGLIKMEGEQVDWPRQGAKINYDGHVYILTCEPCPIEDEFIDGIWYPSCFTCSAIREDDIADADGWQTSYTLTWDIKPDAPKGPAWKDSWEKCAIGGIHPIGMMQTSTAWKKKTGSTTIDDKNLIKT